MNDMDTAELARALMRKAATRKAMTTLLSFDEAMERLDFNSFLVMASDALEILRSDGRAAPERDELRDSLLGLGAKMRDRPMLLAAIVARVRE